MNVNQFRKLVKWPKSWINLAKHFFYKLGQVWRKDFLSSLYFRTPRPLLPKKHKGLDHRLWGDWKTPKGQHWQLLGVKFGVHLGDGEGQDWLKHLVKLLNLGRGKLFGPNKVSYQLLVDHDVFIGQSIKILQITTSHIFVEGSDAIITPQIDLLPIKKSPNLPMISPLGGKNFSIEQKR